MMFPALMFVFGVWNVQQLPRLPHLTGLLWLSVLLMLLVAVLIWQRSSVDNSYLKLRPLLLGLAAFVFGVCWASSCALWRMGEELPKDWQQQPIRLVGVVSSVPELTERGQRFKLNVERVLTPGAVVPSHISLNQYREDYFTHGATGLAIKPAQQFHAGQRWQLLVSLKRPHATQNPHGFDYEAWALAENIRASGSIKTGRKHAAANVLLQDMVWQPQYVIERIRENVKQHIAQVLAAKPYFGIIQALVMGDDSQVRAADSLVFLQTGTSHLISISGLHITMLSGLAFALVSLLWRRSPRLVLCLATVKAATSAGLVVALLYAMLAGFSVPTQRTLYMLLVFAVALWSGRQLLISQVLSLALCMVLLMDPWAVIAPGFWLSFGAVAVMVYALGARIGQAHWLKAALQTQWAVTLGMLPLLLLMFNQSSMVSPLANAFAIPVISFVVTPLALFASFLHVDSLLYASYFALELCMQGLAWLSQLPASTWQQAEPPCWTLLPALLGVLWLLLPRGFPLRSLGLLGFLPMLLYTPPKPALGEMKVSVLDVGQGLSVVVQTASHTLLYDAGPRYNAQSDAGSRIVVPFLRGEGVAKLDGFVVSHNDNDHSGGMQSVLATLPMAWFASSLPAADLPRTTAQTMPCYAGQHWAWDGVSFDVLYPDLASYGDASVKDNNRSCVLKISSRSGSLLLTGDIEKPAEAALLVNYPAALASDVLVAPHHGSKTSSSEPFLSAVSPTIVIFTVGYLNRFKHPASTVVARYQARQITRYRSDVDGALQLDFKAAADAKAGIAVSSWRSRYRRYWHDSE